MLIHAAVMVGNGYERNPRGPGFKCLDEDIAVVHLRVITTWNKRANMLDQGEFRGSWTFAHLECLNIGNQLARRPTDNDKNKWPEIWKNIFPFRMWLLQFAFVTGRQFILDNMSSEDWRYSWNTNTKVLKTRDSKNRSKIIFLGESLN